MIESRSGPLPDAARVGEKLLWVGPTFTEYENGKERRYTLLFAVNGGAFALAKFLIERTAGEEAEMAGAAQSVGMFGLEPIQFGLAMIAFNLAMFADIYSFGWRSAFFSEIGQLVLGIISTTLIAAWALASGLANWLVGWLAAEGQAREAAAVAGVAAVVVLIVAVALEKRPFRDVDLHQTERRMREKEPGR